MAELIIIAHITAHPDKIDLIKTELSKLVPITRGEDGCLSYDLHQDNDNPAHFFFYEVWASRAQWQTHMQAAHIAAYVTATEGAVAEVSLSELTRFD